MKRTHSSLLTALVFISFAFSARAQLETMQRGTYVFHSERDDMCIELVIPIFEMGKPTQILYSAFSLSGRGSAPDGVLRGSPADGFWEVRFQDSFGNRGKGRISLKPGKLVIDLEPTLVEDPRAARFYGTFELLAQREES